MGHRRAGASGAQWIAIVAGLAAPLAAAQDADPELPQRGAEEQPEGDVVRPPGVRVQPESREPVGRLPPLPRPGQPADPGLAADEIELPDMPDPMELTTLIRYVIDRLGVNVAIDPGLQGSIVLNAPMRIKREDLLTVVNALLEQRGYAMTYDTLTGWYQVVPVANVGVGLQGALATTRVINTPNVKPSALQQVISAQFGPPGQQAQQMGMGGAVGDLRISYVDDLGIIVVTGPPRKTQAVVALVERVLDERGRIERVSFDLTHVAATAARERLIKVVGGATQQTGIGGRIDPNTGQLIQAGPRLDNLADRLTVSPQGNRLIFRGFPEEVHEVTALLEDIDRPNLLEARQYFTGSATSQIADVASSLGLGQPKQLAAPEGDMGGFRVGPDGSLQPLEATITGGSIIIADPARGYIVYYGTQEQHEELARIVERFKPEGEVPVLEVYKVVNGNSEDIAEIIQGLLSNTMPTGTSELLPGQGGRGGGRTGAGAGRGAGQRAGLFSPEEMAQAAEAGVATFTGGEDVFVLADRANNQIVVKAPLRQQTEFERLIRKLDLRRPQVFIKAQIVAVSASEDFRLAFETQLINAGGESGAFSTNFGLGTFPVDDILARKVVPLSLSGATGAVILNDYVPIIINALERDVNGRVVATPQLLVDDNEQAIVTSVEVQPTLTTVQGGDTTQIATGPSVEAGTTLTVTPRISEGGYLHLSYEITLSNFIGEPAVPGQPPPSQDRTISADSVTIPNGMTIVVGGLTFENLAKTVVKVPLLGDIPLLGHLFRSTQKSMDNTTLYVFLTPQIMRDPEFRDLALLSKGPQAEAGIDPDIPRLRPQIIESFEVWHPEPDATEAIRQEEGAD